MSNKKTPQDADNRPAVGGPVERMVRPLLERLHATAHWQLTEGNGDDATHQALQAAIADIERWEAYREELADMEKRLGKISGNFLALGAWEDAAKCALKADGMKWVRGRMPPAA